MPAGIIVELFLEKSLPECGYEYDEGMPIGEPTKLNLPRTIFFVVISLGVGIALLFAVIKLAGDGDIQIKLGVDIFDVGDAEQRAERIRNDKAPLLFPSLNGVSRPIYVQHLGDDYLDDWFAIDARSPSEPEKCNLGWDSALQLFFDECDADTTYPPSGEGLVRYAVTINEDESLRVDLNKLVDD